MQVVHPMCCGLDVHQAIVTACLRRVSDAGEVTTDLRTFGTTYPELLALSDWLIEQHCPVVAMESTGIYWKPIYHVVEGVVEVLVGNAREMKPRPEKASYKRSIRPSEYIDVESRAVRQGKQPQDSPKG